MHYALNFGNRNPLHSIGRQLLSYMMQVKKPVTKQELLTEFGTDLRAVELDEVIQFLTYTEKIISKDNRYLPKALLNSAFITKINGSPVDKKIKGADLPAIPLDTPLQEGEKGDFDEPI